MLERLPMWGSKEGQKSRLNSLVTHGMRGQDLLAC